MKRQSPQLKNTIVSIVLKYQQRLIDEQRKELIKQNKVVLSLFDEFLIDLDAIKNICEERGRY